MSGDVGAPCSAMCSDGLNGDEPCCLAPVAVPGLSGIVQVALGEEHSCALGSDGLVSCWGSNAHGQLGDGTMQDRATPGPVAGLFGVRQIAAGWEHTCALLEAGHVRCWGAGDEGQLGDGTTEDHSRPVDVALAGVMQIASSWNTTCALIVDGSAACWGYNGAGGGPVGPWWRCTATDVAGDPICEMPVVVPDVQPLASVAAFGAGVRRADGLVVDWGDGPLLAADPAHTLDAFGAVREFAGMFAGGLRCAVRRDDTVECAQYTLQGLGAPSALPSLGRVVHVAVGEAHACALGADDTVSCWGQNGTGQLGTGDEQSRPTPVAVRW